MIFTLEFINQIAPDPGPEPICSNWHFSKCYELERWKTAKNARERLLRKYEVERTLNILLGEERPFPCKNLEPAIQEVNSVPSPSNQEQAA